MWIGVKIWCSPSITIGKNTAPRINPATAPPNSITELIIPISPFDINPAIGIIINIVKIPVTNKDIVGTIIISSESGITLWRAFSIFTSINTARITPITPPCPGSRAESKNIFFNGSSGFIAERYTIPPITPPKPSFPLKTLAAFIPINIFKYP